jgi:hypothetical protein
MELSLGNDHQRIVCLEGVSGKPCRNVALTRSSNHICILGCVNIENNARPPITIIVDGSATGVVPKIATFKWSIPHVMPNQFVV